MTCVIMSMLFFFKYFFTSAEVLYRGRSTARYSTTINGPNPFTPVYFLVFGKKPHNKNKVKKVPSIGI